MASNDPELKDGFPLPIWMKTKPTKGYEPFAGSPPAHEDNFFYIRYPNSDLLFGKNKNLQEVPNVISEPKDLNTKAACQTNKLQDWSKHTKPCQDVLHGIAPINTGVSSAIKPKPAGTDDGFKGEGAACGNSIVKVAHQMISSSRGFTVASPDDGGEPEPPYRPSRRGSKSLPASPRSSPTSRRKIQNRYFTSPFEPVEDGSGRSWLTMALLGFKKDLTTSTSTLAEEDAIETRLQGSTLAESVENLGPSPRNKKIPEMVTEEPSLAKPANAFRPKPSELREMNFWSPTSM